VDVVIDKAVAIAMDDQPGPVLVDVPISVANAEQPDAAPVRRVRPTRGGPPAGADLEGRKRRSRGLPSATGFPS
jgi:acetolactate synthase-1/2/3 large subunit